MNLAGILMLSSLQVFSSVKLCCSVLDQSLVLSVLADLLANATNLMTLRINSVISYESSVLEGYSNSANFSFTASSSTYSPVPSLSLVGFLPTSHVQGCAQVLRCACKNTYARNSQFVKGTQ